MPIISRILGRKRKDKRRPPFKDLYGLNQRQSIRDFEQKLIRGMHSEQKEICVTAFCRDDEVLKVTANIGSRFSCQPSDNYFAWGLKAQAIGAAEIRHYHNHIGRGRSRFSDVDKHSYRAFRKMIQPSGVRIRFFLVYPRKFLGGYAIKEF